MGHISVVSRGRIRSPARTMRIEAPMAITSFSLKTATPTGSEPAASSNR